LDLPAALAKIRRIPRTKADVAAYLGRVRELETLVEPEGE
jgi:hypothetical protein